MCAMPLSFQNYQIAATISGFIVDPVDFVWEMGIC